jgi:hypothetical protein
MEVVQDQVKSEETKQKNVIIVTGNEVFAINQCLSSILDASTNITGKLHYALSKNLKYVLSVIKEIGDERNDILKSFCELNKHGNPKIDDKGQLIFLKGGEEEANKLFNELLNKEYKVQVYEIPLKEYEKVNIDTSKLKFDGLLFEYYITE